MKIYLASPYSHANPGVRLLRFKQVSLAAGQLMKQGHVVFCPIAMTHPIADLCELPKDWRFWEHQDTPFLEWCDQMIVLKIDGWDSSIGVSGEMTEIQKMGKPISFLEPSPEVLALDEKTESKPDPTVANPKDICGSSKLPLHLFPATAIAMGCIGMLNGLLQYGRDNFRAIGIRASIYKSACDRHMQAWFEGEECDPVDGVPHLAAAEACIAIIIDARAAGKMIDDRKVRGGYLELVKELTPHVNRLKELHKGKSPKHYTIEDQL